MNESPELVGDSSTPRRGDPRSVARPRPAPLVTFGAGVLIAALVGAILVVALPRGPAPLTEREVRATVENVLASQVPGPPASALVYQAIAPSIVLIRTDRPGNLASPRAGLSPDDAPQPNQPAPSPGAMVEGIGTGVVVAGGGEVLTAWHVIDGASLIELTYADGTMSDAMVIVARPEDDVAVLRPSRQPRMVDPAVLGNPNALRIGNEAFVVGHPLGLAGSLSTGVISGLERSFIRPDTGRMLEGLIQFDAAVNPGNSGGPLLNRSAHVTGIVTALINPNQDEVFIGIGLAVPIDVAAAAAGMPPY